MPSKTGNCHVCTREYDGETYIFLDVSYAGIPGVEEIRLNHSKGVSKARLESVSEWLAENIKSITW